MDDKVLDYILSPDNDLIQKVSMEEEYKLHSLKLDEMYKKLVSGMNEEQAKILENFSTLKAYCEGLAAETFLKAGIKFGVRFAMECLSE